MGKRNLSSTALLILLRNPSLAATLTGEEWNHVIVSGRKTQLLGQLAGLLKRTGYLDDVPAPVRRHLSLELLLALRRRESVLWELDLIRTGLGKVSRLLLLKGCAYLVCDDMNAEGRNFSDVDLLVDKANLDAAQGALIAAGWKPGAVSAYDDNYYRNWMHEVPPMEHVRTHSVIDLHHAINPPVSRFFVPPAPLLNRATEVSTGIWALSPIDRIIHCAIHLIQEGEAKKLPRDLWDLHLLLTQHAPEEQQLRQLEQRAQQLGVEQLLYAATIAAEKIYGNRNFAAGFFAQHPMRTCGYSWFLSRMVIAATQGVMALNGRKRVWAQWGLLAHSHMIKMPLTMLIPHLIRKGTARFKAEDKHE